jgi:hypothetical protein
MGGLSAASNVMVRAIDAAEASNGSEVDVPD